MEVVVTQEAVRALRDAVERLGETNMARAHWCAFVGEWLVHTGAAPMGDEEVLCGLPLVAGVEKALGRETSKVSLMALPEGSFVMLANDLSYTGFAKLNAYLGKAFEETRLPQTQYQWQVYDLTLEWDEFQLAYRRIMAHYTRELSFQEKMEALEDLLRHTLHKQDTRATRGRPIKVLFGEYGAGTGRLMVPLLDPNKVSLFFADTGEETIKAYAANPPHMFFLDSDLPDLNGLAVLDRIKRHDPMIHPIIMSSRPDPELARQAGQRHVKGYLVRPFTPQKVVDYIEVYRRLNGWA